ncbi:MAG: exopolysaccharide biosynthesis protein [Alphaproteobacteria bacterium]|nr:exopolysaccharide biosynthesis protein [Alphaproteobacteria bacterium]
MRALSDVFTDFKTALTTPEVTIGDILEALHERGFGFILLLFALPMALPIPVPPGINILLATPLLILTAQQALGRHTIWMPERLKRKAISRNKLCGVIDSALPLLKRIEALTRPRLGFITDGLFSNLIGILGLIMALTVCIPLPLTNTVPSMGIALMALGVIMRDGLAVIAGALIGTAWVCMLAFAVLFFGAEGLDIVKETIKSFF